MSNSRQRSVEPGSLSFPFSFRVVVDEAACREDVNHYHLEQEMLLVGEGDYTVHLDDMKFAVHKGDLVIIPAGVPHRFEHLEIKLPIYNQDGTITTEDGTLNPLEHIFTTKDGVTTSSEKAIAQDSVCTKALDPASGDTVPSPLTFDHIGSGSHAGSSSYKSSSKAELHEISAIASATPQSITLDAAYNGKDDDFDESISDSGSEAAHADADVIDGDVDQSASESAAADVEDEMGAAQDVGKYPWLGMGSKFETVDGQEWRWNDKKERDFKRLECIGRSDRYVYKCLYFDPSLVLEMGGAGKNFLEAMHSGQIKLQPVFYRTNPDDRAVISAFDELCETVETVYYDDDNKSSCKFSKRSALELKAYGQFLTLMGILQYERHYMTHDKKQPPARRQVQVINDVIRYIASHYKENITLNDLAEAVKLKPTYLCRAFKEITDKTPVEYINAMRMDEACRQLSETDKRISSIVDELGFKDAGYFARVFKKYTGLKPRDFRNAYQKGIAPADAKNLDA